MRIAPQHILDHIYPLLKQPHRRKIRWKGKRLEEEMLKRGWYKCRGTEAYRKRFGKQSVHIKCYDHGCYYHVDNH